MLLGSMLCEAGSRSQGPSQRGGGWEPPERPSPSMVQKRFQPKASRSLLTSLLSRAPHLSCQDRFFHSDWCQTDAEECLTSPLPKETAPRPPPSVSLTLVLPTHRQGHDADELATYLPGTQLWGPGTGQAHADHLAPHGQPMKQCYAVDGFTVVNTYEAHYAGQNRKWSGNAHLVHTRTRTHTHAH